MAQVPFSTELSSYHDIVVIGLGLTGLSVVEHLIEHAPHAKVKVIDTRDTAPGSDKLPNAVALHSGGWNEAWLAECDLVVCSPGIAVATPEVAAVAERGVPVVGDIELFAWAVTKPVIGITGSNGKSTVTDLTGQLAEASGIKAGVGGNIGVPALSLLKQDCDLYVLELSSFQLETTYTLPLVAATCLNLSEDHMDRYKGMADYREAKMRIFANAQHALVNADDIDTFPDETNARLSSFGMRSATSDYGLGGDVGSKHFVLNGKPSFATSGLSIVGMHNVSNALVALALLDLSGINTSKCESALNAYQGLAHRCQVVQSRNGVRWVNDSKATNVASTLAALSGLELDGQLYLLVGGDGKGADFSELASVLATLPVTLCCFGRDGEQFMDLAKTSVRYQTMDEAIAAVSPKLVSGDMVMLSPACASFDQYPNFMRRGDAFVALAEQYA